MNYPYLYGWPQKYRSARMWADRILGLRTLLMYIQFFPLAEWFMGAPVVWSVNSCVQVCWMPDIRLPRVLHSGIFYQFVVLSGIFSVIYSLHFSPVWMVYVYGILNLIHSSIYECFWWFHVWNNVQNKYFVIDFVINFLFGVLTLFLTKNLINAKSHLGFYRSLLVFI